jgi:hypothetical protein
MWEGTSWSVCFPGRSQVIGGSKSHQRPPLESWDEMSRRRTYAHLITAADGPSHADSARSFVPSWCRTLAPVNLVLAALSGAGRVIGGAIRFVRRRLKLSNEEHHPDETTLQAEQIVQSRDRRPSSEGDATGR